MVFGALLGQAIVPTLASAYRVITNVDTFTQSNTQVNGLQTNNPAPQLLDVTNGVTANSFSQQPTVVGAAAQAFSSADLATGELKVSSTAIESVSINALPGEFGSANASSLAGFADQITIHLNGLLSTTFSIGFDLTGTFATESTYVAAQGTGTLYNLIISGPGGAGILNQGTFLGEVLSQNCTNGTTRCSLLPIHDVATFTIFADGTYDIFAFIAAGSRSNLFGGGTVDFSNTGSFFIDLPPGVTFTSQSRVFLTEQQDTVEVPEASSLLLLTGGLMFMIVTMIGKMRNI